MATALLIGCTVEEEPQEGASQFNADVVIGSYGFTESNVLAQIYKLALEREGFEVAIVPDISSRELMIPALEQGVIDLVPEYEGTLANFLGWDQIEDISTLRTSLQFSLSKRNLTALGRTPAQNRNEIVVTAATADRFDITKISDLTEISSELVFGGPPECPSRPLCQPGLERVYGLDFAQFQPLDTGGPLTQAALRGGEIDVGLLFTTDPALSDPTFVVLEDDLGLQPSEHITPVAHAASVQDAGDSFPETLASVNELLTTEVLRDLIQKVNDGMSAESVADQWFADETI